MLQQPSPSPWGLGFAAQPGTRGLDRGQRAAAGAPGHLAVPSKPQLCPANNSTASSRTASTPEGPRGIRNSKREPALAPRPRQSRKGWYRAKVSCKLPRSDQQAGARCAGRGWVSPVSPGGDHPALCTRASAEEECKHVCRR